jgi:hypothetical protein
VAGCGRWHGRILPLGSNRGQLAVLIRAIDALYCLPIIALPENATRISALSNPSRPGALK